MSIMILFESIRSVINVLSLVGYVNYITQAHTHTYKIV